MKLICLKLRTCKMRQWIISMKQCSPNYCYLFSAGEVLHETDQYQTDATIDSSLDENEDDGNESLEPGEAGISNFSDYWSEPYIPPNLSRMQQDKINERFQLIRRKGKCE